jgi:hypothetical protein
VPLLRGQDLDPEDDRTLAEVLSPFTELLVAVVSAVLAAMTIAGALTLVLHQEFGKVYAACLLALLGLIGLLLVVILVCHSVPRIGRRL